MAVAQSREIFAMNGLCRQLFPRTGFSLNQHCRTRARIEHDGVANLFHGHRFPAHVVQRIACAQTAASRRVDALPQRQAGHLQRIAEGLADGGFGIDKDSGHARLFGEVGNQPCAHDRVYAVGLQFVDLPSGVFFGDVATLLKL